MNIKTLTLTLIAMAASLSGCGDVSTEQSWDQPAAKTEQTAMPTGKADRATIDPAEVTSEGSGEHGIEEPNQQDRTLHRTLQAAAWAAQAYFPKGAQHFLHFLGNSGDILQMEVDRLLADNPIEDIEDRVTSFEARIDEQIELAKAEADVLIREAEAEIEAIEASWDGEWQQFYATNGDWYWALGGFQYRLTAEIRYIPDNPVVISYRVEVEDNYNWDAGKEIELRFGIKITDEMFQRLHIVGIAQEFSIEGVSSEYIVEYDYEVETE